MITIRPETDSDIESVRKINKKAFGRPDESGLIDKLRHSCTNLLSLIAELDKNVVAHILFSPVVIDSTKGVIHGFGLGPMATLPEYQHQGIGGSLINTGLAMLTKKDCPFVVVLGHPTYYPRFGFEPASNFGIGCEWDVPDEVFMIQVFNKILLDNIKGTALYRDEFNELD